MSRIRFTYSFKGLKAAAAKDFVTCINGIGIDRVKSGLLPLFQIRYHNTIASLRPGTDLIQSDTQKGQFWISVCSSVQYFMHV